MTDDERQIRELVATWMRASEAGDTETVLGLMTDDVVFLLPGREPMRKPEFAAAARAQASAQGPRMEGNSDIQELVVAGDWGFLWTRLAITVTLPDGSPPMQRAGHTLTVVRREQGRWKLARDANLLAPVQKAGG